VTISAPEAVTIATGTSSTRTSEPLSANRRCPERWASQLCTSGTAHGVRRKIAALTAPASSRFALSAMSMSRPRWAMKDSSWPPCSAPNSPPCAGLDAPTATVVASATTMASVAAHRPTGPSVAPARAMSLRARTMPIQTATHTRGSASVASRSQCSTNGGSLRSWPPSAWCRNVIHSPPP
jgi:hypothetical protein